LFDFDSPKKEKEDVQKGRSRLSAGRGERRGGRRGRATLPQKKRLFRGKEGGKVRTKKEEIALSRKGPWKGDRRGGSQCTQ